jgi:hypothetical protein
MRLATPLLLLLPPLLQTHGVSNMPTVAQPVCFEHTRPGLMWCPMAARFGEICVCGWAGVVRQPS